MSEERERFVIDSEGKAAWALDKILEARANLERRTAAAREWIKVAQDEVDDLEARFLGELEAWYKLNPPRKGRTITLPTGKLSMRATPGGPRVVDAGKARAWAHINMPDAVTLRTVLGVDARVIRDYVASTGEVVPGVEIVPDSDTFKVDGPKERD